MKVNGVEVTDCVGCSESEIQAYIRHVESKTGGALSKLAIRLERAGTVALEYEVLHRRFERIRRITG